MRKTIIVAFDESRCMGTDDGLPWKIREEMEHFRTTTTGFPVIMGRKTWETLPEKYRPLPGRKNIVLSRNADSVFPGAEHASSMEEAMDVAEKSGAEEVFVIGGLSIYLMSIGKVDRIVASRIKGVHEGTHYFPDYLDFEFWECRLLKSHELFNVYEYTRKDA